MIKRTAVTVVLTLLAFGLAPTTPSGAAATWGADVRLVYAQGGDIWVAHPSGSHTVNLTQSGAVETSPSMSRTGRYVTYQKFVGGLPEAWLYDLETDEHRQLGIAGGSATDFSPTSDRIAYGRYASATQTFKLYSAELDGTGVKDWLGASDDYNLMPRWSADGASLIFYNADRETTRHCRVDMGGYDEISYAYRLSRVSAAGAVTELAGDDNHSVRGGHEGGGTLAYVRTDLPPTGDFGYCSTEPSTSYELVVNGSVAGSATPFVPSVNAEGDVAYTSGPNVMVDPAGADGPQVLFPGSHPDWGVAYGASEPACTITGSEQDDRLEGTAGRDVICGLAGNDYLFGFDGNDVLRGGDGEDDLIGGPGKDELDGGKDSDALRGEEGDDLLDGGEGVDLVTYFTIRQKVAVHLGKGTAVSAPHGRDTLVGVEGAFGSKTDDLLIGDRGSNHLFGGPGADVVRGGGGTDILRGNAGVDRLEGGGAADLLEGDEGKDALDGGAAQDVCYDTAAKRTSCELTEKDDPAKTGKPPVDGDDSGTVGRVSRLRLAGGGTVTYWYLGKGDYLTVYDRAATQALGSWAATAGWESQTCHFIRLTPARGACSAAGALNTVSKYQMKWFLWNAKRNNGCAIGILDWGRHGVNQFKKRWKTRAATYYRYNVAIPWVTPGRTSYVKMSTGGYVGVGCG